MGVRPAGVGADFGSRAPKQQATRVRKDFHNSLFPMKLRSVTLALSRRRTFQTKSWLRVIRNIPGKGNRGSFTPSKDDPRRSIKYECTACTFNLSLVFSQEHLSQLPEANRPLCQQMEKGEKGGSRTGLVISQSAFVLSMNTCLIKQDRQSK
jgi:hypothetical protein